jgi:hypothetical protein
MAARAGEWAEAFVNLSGLLVAAGQTSKTDRAHRGTAATEE